MRSLLAALLLLPGAALADPPAVGAVDDLLFCPFSPGLEVDPADPDRLIAACGIVPGAFPIPIDPAGPMSLPGPHYLLPGTLDCSESGGGASPDIASLWLDASPRGWLVTSICDLAVPFDTSTGLGWPIEYEGAERSAVPTRRTITGSFTTYRHGLPGNAIASFDTDFTSAVVRVGNRLLVATSNFAPGGTGSNPENEPGTVLLFDIDDGGPVTTVDPAVPPYLITSDPNPTALTVLPGGLVAVTNTGLLDTAFPPQVTGVGSIDIVDPVAATVLGSVPLAPNPGGRSLAIDLTESVAVASSHTQRVLFAIDIRNLADLPDPGIDPTLQRPSCNDGPGPEAGGVPCLRSRAIHGSANPLALDTPTQPGFLPEVRFGAAGDFLAATSFNDNGLAFVAFDAHNIGLPHPLLPSRFGLPAALPAPLPPGELGPGPMVLHDTSFGGFAGSWIVWASSFPSGVVTRATLSGDLAAPGGDFDLDGVEDVDDNCPVTANQSQSDSGSVGAGPADLIGDACQCGDVDDDGVVTAADTDALRAFLADPPGLLPAPQKCDVSGDQLCGVADLVYSARALAGQGPGLVQGCAPATL